MARIVSGLSPEEVNFAYLKGSEQGLGLAAQQSQQAQERSEAERNRQTKLQAEMIEAFSRHKREQAKSQELLNQQAQMGDAYAIQELALKAQMDQNPELSMLQDAQGMLGQITDPDARRLALGAVDDIFKQYGAHKERGAAETAIQRAKVNDPAFDDIGTMSRMDAGEDPKVIMRELGQAEQERTIKSLAMKKSAAAIEQAQALIDSSPQGTPERLEAEALQEMYLNSPFDQEKPNSDAEHLFKVRKALIESPTAKLKREDAFMEAQRARASKSGGEEDARFGERSFPGGGVFGSREQEPHQKTPAMAKHIESQKAEKAKRAAAMPREGRKPLPTASKAKPIDVKSATLEVIEQASDPSDLVRLLKERGIRMTPSVIAEVRQATEEWRNRVASGASADR